MTNDQGIILKFEISLINKDDMKNGQWYFQNGGIISLITLRIWTLILITWSDQQWLIPYRMDIDSCNKKWLTDWFSKVKILILIIWSVNSTFWLHKGRILIFVKSLIIIGKDIYTYNMEWSTVWLSNKKYDCFYSDWLSKQVLINNVGVKEWSIIKLYICQEVHNCFQYWFLNYDISAK